MVLAASVSTLTRALYTAQFTPGRPKTFGSWTYHLTSCSGDSPATSPASPPTCSTYLPVWAALACPGSPPTSTRVNGAWHKGRSSTKTTRPRRCIGFWTGRLGIAGARWYPANQLKSTQPRAPPHGAVV